MFHRYQYEAAFYPTLSRLPLDLRRKLDLTGVKLSLEVWQSFSFEERTVLCHLPCETDEETQALSNYIDFLSRRYTGTPVEMIEPLNAALWQPSAVPQAVIEQSAALHRAVTLDRWRLCSSHDRYALYKTAVSKSQPEAFEQVLNQVLRRAES